MADERLEKIIRVSAAVDFQRTEVRKLAIRLRERKQNLRKLEDQLRTLLQDG